MSRRVGKRSGSVRYQGVMIVTATSCSDSASGNALETSPSPPTLEKGATSIVANRIFMGEVPFFSATDPTEFESNMTGERRASHIDACRWGGTGEPGFAG